MRTAFEEGGTRIDDAKLIVSRVAQACSAFDDDGIQVRFMNSRTEVRRPQFVTCSRSTLASDEDATARMVVLTYLMLDVVHIDCLLG